MVIGRAIHNAISCRGALLPAPRMWPTRPMGAGLVLVAVGSRRQRPMSHQHQSCSQELEHSHRPVPATQGYVLQPKDSKPAPGIAPGCPHRPHSVILPAVLSAGSCTELHENRRKRGVGRM